jgi:TolB-like protein/class 3 adenylate cyclase/Flp pilus assembly protein TadD
MQDDTGSTVQAEQRRLAAIMFTDMVGFSRQMGADEARTLRILAVHNQVIEQAVAAHQGHIIKTAGDGFLIEFPSVVHAVQCAQSIQAQLHSHNAAKAKPDQIHVRIGIHLGDIVVQPNGDVLGDGVNIASRLQALAAPDTICISDMVYRDVAQKVPLGAVVSLGRPTLKNIAQRFPVYELLSEPPKGVRQTLRLQCLKLSRRVGIAHRVVLAGLVLLAAGIVTGKYFLRSPLSPQHSELGTPAALTLPDKPSIIVLPFTNMSGDPGQEYFSDGITEDITADLSKLSGFFVIARNSAFTYKGKAVKVQEVSREMGVRYVLEGSVRKVGEQVRVTAQLIDGTTGGHVWSARYDRPLRDIFAVQDEIVQQLVTTLRVEVQAAEQERVRRIPTTNLTAYDAYLRGVEYLEPYTKEAIAKARQMFEQVIALDPQYAAAYALLSATYWRESVWNPDPQTRERALALAQQAVALDDTLSAAHLWLGLAYQMKTQYEPAITELEQAIALDPNSAEGYAGLGSVLNAAGRPVEAMGWLEKAMRFHPRYPFWYALQLGIAYRLTGRYAEAIATQKQVLLRNPNNEGAYGDLAINYVQQWGAQLSQDSQTLEQALAVAQRAVALNDYWATHAVLGYVYLYQQQYEQAVAEVERAVALNPNVATSYASLAEVLSRAGRADEAQRAAEQAQRLKPYFADQHLYPIGMVYALAGRYTDALAPLQQFLTRYPDILGAHLTLAAVYSELGKEAEARAEAAEVLRLNPKFSLEVHKERVPIKGLAMLERHIAALRKAGLK